MKTNIRQQVEEHAPTSIEKWVSILSSVWPILTALVLVSGMIIMNNYKADTALTLAASNAEAIEKQNQQYSRLQEDRGNKYAELKSDVSTLKAESSAHTQSLERIERKVDAIRTK